MAGEPLAVAFVEVRPDVQDFRSQTEAEVAADLGTAPVEIDGQLRLAGLDQARRDVAALSDELNATAQVDVQGLDTAARDVRNLETEIASLSTASTEEITEQLNALGPSAADATGAVTAVSDSLRLAQQSGLGAAGALRATESAAGGSAAAAATAAAALRQEAVAARQAAVEEDELNRVRIRAGRSRSVGGFRLAGAGLLIGTGLFAATRAVGAFADSLEVSGNQAVTAGGKLRNFAAGVLRGDVVGAFTALANTTRDFSREELIAIARTEGLEDALEQMGQGANLARSRLEELQKLSSNPVPQVVETAIARAQLTGDPESELKNVRAAGVAIDKAIGAANEVEGKLGELRSRARRLTAERGQVLEELARQRSAGRDTIPGGPVPRLENQAAALTGAINDTRDEIEQRRSELSPALQSLFKQRQANKELEQRLVEQAQQARTDRVTGIIEAFADRQLVAELAGAEEQVRAILREEQARLRGIVAQEEQGTEAWRTAAGQLKTVNESLETIADNMAAEQQRHMQEMLAKAIFPAELAQARSAALGDEGGLVAGLQEERQTLQGQIDAKELTGAALVSAYNRIASINEQLEGIAAANVAEAERHRNEMRQERDRQHQLLLESIGGQEARLQNDVLRAALTGGLADDVRRNKQLQDFYRAQSRNEDLTLSERRSFVTKLIGVRQTLAGLQETIRSLRQQEREERTQERQDALDAREDQLQDALAIARTTDKSDVDDQAAIRKQIQFFRKQSRNAELSVGARRDYLVKLKQAQQELRNLKKEEDDARDGTSLADLFRQQVDISKQAGFDLGPQVAGQVTQPVEDEVGRRLRAQVSVRASIDPSTQKRVSSEENLVAAIERLTAVIQTNGDGGGSGPRRAAGEVEGQRYQAMARFYQSRRAKQLLEETASA